MLTTKHELWDEPWVQVTYRQYNQYARSYNRRQEDTTPAPKCDAPSTNSNFSYSGAGSHALATRESQVTSEHDSYARVDTRDVITKDEHLLYYDRHTTSFFHQQMKLKTLQTSS